MKTLILCGAILLIGVALLADFGYTTNCGGNSAALGRVEHLALLALGSYQDAPDRTFRFAVVDSLLPDQLFVYRRSDWLPRARFLVSTAPISERDAKERRLIVVCDTPYRNVPRRWIGSPPPTHAAGYADGSYGLISPADFAALDRSTFTPADALLPASLQTSEAP